MNRMFFACIVIGICLAVTPSAAFAQILAAAPLFPPTKSTADRSNAAKPAPSGTTRVAVVNLGVVLTKYERAAALKDEMNQEMKQLQEEAKQLTQDLAAWQTALQKNELGGAKKEQYEEKIINARRRLEDMTRIARGKVGKAQEASIIQLWNDVREAVKAYSAEHGIQLVIAYGDPKEASLLDLFPNINRKMQAIDQGGSAPFLIGPGVDISEAVVGMMNRQYREKTQMEPTEEQEDR